MKGSERQDLNNRFTSALERIISKAYTSILEEWQTQDLTILQVRILQVLQDHGPIRMGQLVRTLDHNMSSATSLIDRLVEKNLVERNPSPQRSPRRGMPTNPAGQRNNATTPGHNRIDHRKHR